ncbi:beta-N-acetylhexosaminidase [Parapedobacter sp. SGR-10]|uniref:beta-N-acetylhexosaminidase n=1 Tax=Parapedobacter sp. SGR-10 TaxID=2710879 RepID=UPI0013D108B4|nr:beta-N-acetylhexosaminidase [Parapedobacter sp. SGR-10]NGF57056.1 beta-N-acetylhexosaminidase [Parapedobacter sp. SGR-10]
MKRITILILTLCMLGIAAKSCPVIPIPKQCVSNGDFFTLDRNVVIVGVDDELSSYLQSALFRYTQIPVKVGKNTANANTIRLVLDSRPSFAEGGYSLEITGQQVVIRSDHKNGLFNGISTFLQISSAGQKQGFRLDGVKIVDQPRFKWRGVMIDEARHFFGKEKIKQILDWMAFYKLNKFHWHLTDSQGWRMQIKQYPKLTAIGGIGNFSDPFYQARFYTQKDITEIVEYASQRFIEVIPEVDMPGHAAAAVKAYPEFSGGGSAAHPDFTFNPGKEETYSFLTNILREVDVLFPSQMIHIGGDEVHYGNEKWNQLPEVADLMKKNNLSDLKEVELYFFKRMSDSLQNLNNKILAWDEVVGNNIGKNHIVFWWRHNRLEQLRQALDKKVNVVMCPRSPFYFDYMQDSSQVYGPDYKKFGVNSVEKIYNFSPEIYGVKTEDMPYILGVQGNLWTERIQSENRLDYMLFPRIASLAETAWTMSDNKDFSSFKDRVTQHYPLYEQDNVYYYDFLDFRRRSEPMK